MIPPQEPQTQQGKTAQFYLKWMMVGATVFIAIAAGIYTGTAVSLRHTELLPQHLLNRSNLDIGDVFPESVLWSLDQRTRVYLSNVLQDSPAVLVFLSAECGACDSYMVYWRKRIIDDLRADIQVLLILDNGESIPGDPLPSWLSLPRARLLSTLDSELNVDVGIVATPAVVGLTANREVRFVSFGANRALTARFLNEHL